MAWQALITAVDVDPANGAITVNANFVDVAQPAVVIDSHTFTFPSSITLAQARTAITTYGSDLRTKLATRATKATQFVGQTVDIP